MRRATAVRVERARTSRGSLVRNAVLQVHFLWLNSYLILFPPLRAHHIRPGAHVTRGRIIFCAPAIIFCICTVERRFLFARRKPQAHDATASILAPLVVIELQLFLLDGERAFLREVERDPPRRIHVSFPIRQLAPEARDLRGSARLLDAALGDEADYFSPNVLSDLAFLVLVVVGASLALARHARALPSVVGGR